MTRRLLHVDMDAFYASVEQRERPELRGLPVAVIATAREGAVMTASYEARTFGVRSAMPVHRAQERCPDLVLVPARMDLYRAVSKQIRDLFNAVTPLVEPVALDEAYLDVSARTASLEDAADLARALQRDITAHTSLTASAGVSVNRFLAKLASSRFKPGGLAVIEPQDVDALLADLPVEAFHGIGPATARKLHARGVRTGRELRALSVAELQALFGPKTGQHFHDIARGHDDRPVDADRVRRSVGVERTFDTDLLTPEDMRAALPDLCAEVARRLAALSMAGRTVTLKVRFSNWRLATRATTRADAVSDGDVLRDVASGLLDDDLLGGRGVRLLGVTVSNLVAVDHVGRGGRLL